MILWVKGLSVFGNWRSYLNWRYRTDPKHWYRTFNKYRNRGADPHWFNADPDTDPDPVFLWPKIEKKITAGNLFFIFLIKNCKLRYCNQLFGRNGVTRWSHSASTTSGGAATRIPTRRIRSWDRVEHAPPPTSPCRSEITGQRERKSGSVGQCFGSESGLDPDSISSVDADSEFRLGYGSTDVIESGSGSRRAKWRTKIKLSAFWRLRLLFGRGDEENVH